MVTPGPARRPGYESAVPRAMYPQPGEIVHNPLSEWSPRVMASASTSRAGAVRPRYRTARDAARAADAHHASVSERGVFDDVGARESSRLITGRGVAGAELRRYEESRMRAIDEARRMGAIERARQAVVYDYTKGPFGVPLAIQPEAEKRKLRGYEVSTFVSPLPESVPGMRGHASGHVIMTAGDSPRLVERVPFKEDIPKPGGVDHEAIAWRSPDPVIRPSSMPH